MLKFYKFAMTDNLLVLSQVYQLLGMVSDLCDLNIVVPESLQMEAIIAKLLSKWNDYMKKLLCMTEEFSIGNFLVTYEKKKTEIVM